MALGAERGVRGMQAGLERKAPKTGGLAVHTGPAEGLGAPASLPAPQRWEHLPATMTAQNPCTSRLP